MINKLLLIPSFYGIIGWIFALFMLFISPISTNSISMLGKFVIVYVLFFFAISSFVSVKYYGSIKIKSISKQNFYFLFFICGFIGIIGLIKYYIDFSSYIGGWKLFIDALILDPLTIRAMASTETSIGFQLSYFSWIALFTGTYYVCSETSYNLKHFFYIFFCILIFILNLGFIDRTRPVWLLILIFFAMASARPSIGEYIKRKLIWLILILTSLIIIFPLITGKYGEEGVANNIFIYIIGGFPYFDTIINESTSYTYTPSHTMYPLFKLMITLGLPIDDVSQISEFRDIPFSTNVGTFILPLIEDGGILYVLVFAPIVIFASDTIAFYMLREKSIISLFIWANIIFSMIMAFFVAKFTTTANYLFFIMYLIFYLKNNQNNFRRKVA